MDVTGMSRDELVDKIKRKQRSLIPLNIVVVIIALVAAVSLLITPLITVDLTNVEQVVAELTDDEQTEGEGENAQADTVTAVLRSLGSQISFTPVGLIEFAMADKNIDYVTNVAAETLTKSTDELIINVGIPTVMQTVKDNNPDVEIPEIEEPEVILEEVKTLETAAPEQVDTAINNVADEIQRQAGADVVNDDIRDEIISVIRDVYDTTVANTPDGNFTLEACICVLASEYLDLDNINIDELLNGLFGGNATSDAGSIVKAASSDSSDGESGTDGDGEKQIFTSYNDLIGHYLNSASSETVENIERTLNAASPFVLIAGIVFIFYAVLWVILALFAFVHIFTKNKRFTMWYVKLFCFAPCFAFGIVPLVAPLIISALGLEIAGTVSLIAGMISTMTWISGGCYILLWLVSIFWAFPIKRKIRQYNSKLSYAV